MKKLMLMTMLMFVLALGASPPADAAPTINAQTQGVSPYKSPTWAFEFEVDVASPVAGEVLLFASANGATGDAPGVCPFGFPAGWYLVAAKPVYGIVVQQLCVMAKVADGTETNFTLTKGDGNGSAWVYFRIGGADTSVPVAVASFANSTLALPNPPNLTPSWGSADVLWFEFTAAYNYATPSVGYTNAYNADTLGYYRAQLSSAYRANLDSSEDPAAFGASNIRTATATVGIKPQ